MNNKSPLRYPGGKTRACKILTAILEDNFDISKYSTVISPFMGGGSFEFHLQNIHGLNIIANDKFHPLYMFWKCVCGEKDSLCGNLDKELGKITKDTFNNIRKTIMHDKDILSTASKYFIINRCSFSGATLSGGFSQQSAKTRFTQSSIDRIRKLDLSQFSIYNLVDSISLEQKRISHL